MKKYIPLEIEAKRAKRWKDEKLFSPDLEKSKKPFYSLMMFPYPSAEGMHVGNMYAFTGSDVYSRFKRLQGFDVFEPIGLDGFGIHGENYALKINEHPMDVSKRTAKHFYEQFLMIGNAFDWQRTVDTYNPNYYKWTQWAFLQLYKKGLAYRKKAEVNWCPSCMTVLADEQVVSGECERCASVVGKKELEQWFFKITDYAEKLLSNIDSLDWSDIVKVAQKNWIGKSEGVLIKFPFVIARSEATRQSQKDRHADARDDGSYLEVFTTRPDTVFGATFLVISPEYPNLDQLVTQEQREEVDNYVQKARQKSDIERQGNKEKTGVFTGSYVENPLTNKDIPVWVADYVLMGYGTGAIMAVPAHDERDFEFAKKYNLPVKPVVLKQTDTAKSFLMGADKISNESIEKIGGKIEKTTKEGDRLVEMPNSSVPAYIDIVKKSLNPGFWNEVVGEKVWFVFKHKNGEIGEYLLDEKTDKAINKLGSEFNSEPPDDKSVWQWLFENEWYHERLIHSETGTLINSGEFNDLLSNIAKNKITNYLAEHHLGSTKTQFHLRDWLISRQRYWGPPIPIIYCDKCGIVPVPEKDLPVELPYIKDFKPTDTGIGPLASDPDFVNTACPKCGGKARRETDVSDNFLDSSLYFFRYLTTDLDDKFFDPGRTKKWLPVDMYIGGAEHSVLHLLYSRFITMAFKDMGFIDFEEPFAKFRAHGLIIKDGAKMSKSKGNVIVPDKYIKDWGADIVRTYLMFMGPFTGGGDFQDDGLNGVYRFLNRIWSLVQNFKDVEATEEEKRVLSKTIQKAASDFENLHYNTVVSALMELLNFLSKQKSASKETIKSILIILSPLSPFITEELWEIMGEKNSVHNASWPKVDEKYLEDEKITVVIQVDGKLRGNLLIDIDIVNNENDIENLALDYPRVKEYLSVKKIVKIIHVPGRVVNFVTGN